MFTNGSKIQRKGGGTSVGNALSVLPLSATCVEVKEQINERIRNNRRMSIDYIAFEIGISRGKKRLKNSQRFTKDNESKAITQTNKVCRATYFHISELKFSEILDLDSLPFPHLLCCSAEFIIQSTGEVFR
jgi:hypothetical protein